MALNFGGTFIDGHRLRRRSCKFGAAEQEVPQRIHDMIYTDKSIAPDVGLKRPDVLPGFFAGKYAMIVGGNYPAQQMVQQSEGGIVAVFPDAVIERGDVSPANLVSHKSFCGVRRFLRKGRRYRKPGIEAKRDRKASGNDEVASRQVEHGPSPSRYPNTDAGAHRADGIRTRHSRRYSRAAAADLRRTYDNALRFGQSGA